MKAKSTFLAWNVLPSPTWAPGRPNDDGPGLPMAAHGGNISPERRIIRRMSAKSLKLAREASAEAVNALAVVPAPFIAAERPRHKPPSALEHPICPNSYSFYRPRLW